MNIGIIIHYIMMYYSVKIFRKMSYIFNTGFNGGKSFLSPVMLFQIIKKVYVHECFKRVNRKVF